MGSGRRYPRGWYRFRNYILERDGHRCQNPECGKPGRLEVSHVLSVRDRPDLELVESNARALCRSCHLAFDAKPIPPATVAWRKLVTELL